MNVIFKHQPTCASSATELIHMVGFPSTADERRTCPIPHVCHRVAHGRVRLFRFIACIVASILSQLVLKMIFKVYKRIENSSSEVDIRLCDHWYGIWLKDKTISSSQTVHDSGSNRVFGSDKVHLTVMQRHAASTGGCGSGVAVAAAAAVRPYLKVANFKLRT